jgi:outer membrane protein
MDSPPAGHTRAPALGVSRSFAGMETRMNLQVRRYRYRAALGLAAVLAGICAAAPAWPLDLKVAIVNINKALNTSEAGERSKKILLATKTQKENDLKAKDTQFRKLVDDTRSNMMLNDSAKAQKEKELRDKESDLRQEVQEAQRDLQEQERKLTESIFSELRAVIAQIGQEKKYDLILEQGASQVILYTPLKFDDLTDEVIERYNKTHGKKP